MTFTAFHPRDIGSIWESVEMNEIVYWKNFSYVVRKSEAIKNCDFQKNHFSYKNGYVLVISHVKGYSSIIHERELKDLNTISEREYKEHLHFWKDCGYICNRILNYQISLLNEEAE